MNQLITHTITDFFTIVFCLCIINLIFGIPILYFISKKVNRDGLSDFYRLMHSTNFDMNYDVLKKLEDTDSRTEELFIKLQLKMHDKLKRQFEDIEKAIYKSNNKEQIINEIKLLKQQYENKDD